MSLDDLREIGTPLAPGAPAGDPATAWERRLLDYRLVSPLNRRKFTVIVVGTGLAGAGCAAALGELGYQVESFTFHDAPRRAHSVAAQGGVNAARGRKVDNDSVARFVKDTVKGGDFRAREADCYRLAQESSRVIDHMNAIGAPFAREYGGSLATRSFGGVQVSRTYYTRGQTGQQLQIAASQALLRQVNAGAVTLHTRTEMLDLIVSESRAVGVITRDLLTGEIRAVTGHAVVLATGGYGNVFHRSTLARNSNASATWRAHLRGALFASPSFIQFHPTALPLSSPWQSKTILMSESLRNDGRIWVPRKPGDDRAPSDIPEQERDYYLERMYPSYGNLAPRDVSSRAARAQIESGHGVGPLKNSVYLDFRDALARLGRDVIAERYGNLFDMYRDATGEDPYVVPMRIAPGAHFAMGGLWSDFDQMTNIPGLFVAGEAGWAYHGANRLGANSLLSACVDGWFTLPYAVPNYLAGLLGAPAPGADDPAVTATLAETRTRVEELLAIDGRQGPDRFHRRLGEILYQGCGVSRSAAGLRTAIGEIDELTGEFWADLRVAGTAAAFNQELEKAGRVADFLGLARLMCVDALDRDESCGAHFRTEHQTPTGEAQRDDEHWAFVSAWEHAPKPIRHDEPLEFTAVPLATRNYV
ncbi:fumarate reductase/succinate dehydrogenase flavoprotein subunit [Mycolicibacterium brumae]|uniref:Succinate dehydrogenase flavoprotein subunit n=1 Tax=Mycolicibacterium brumae TaxID=85968 RepID=A0A2G5PA17_9MYCO|nr:fumarate reductase/succinate dehydrogenase flavoprotein subunit [Mycolicibacterium brumae]MCV7192975.1 fumarate reductase/succinate dehydrogenase flavoprotein subunit [Mycolicibacterium brumae]PIB75192.1 succinate dehydrogenase flavoprotein subunit [Mycolicibacterium brumae]RWA23564.1 succinate dehydrogenase [Mycolicibacterium brumae DSM 44177]UWW08507.1 fumarate reductase/succinate dehydrogenase flavoprotein subunit [Mycolicibacterium brumae]